MLDAGDEGRQTDMLALGHLWVCLLYPTSYNLQTALLYPNYRRKKALGNEVRSKGLMSEVFSCRRRLELTISPVLYLNIPDVIAPGYLLIPMLLNSLWILPLVLPSTWEILINMANIQSRSHEGSPLLVSCESGTLKRIDLCLMLYTFKISSVLTTSD